MDNYANKVMKIIYHLADMSTTIQVNQGRIDSVNVRKMYQDSLDNLQKVTDDYLECRDLEVNLHPRYTRRLLGVFKEWDDIVYNLNTCISKVSLSFTLRQRFVDIDVEYIRKLVEYIRQYYKLEELS